MEVSQLEKFVESINKVRWCVTPHCVGELIPKSFNSSGLGGAISLSYACSVCVRARVVKGAVRPTLLSLLS